MFILGSFSYLGAFIENLYNFSYLKIGFIMTAFGITAVTGGRLSGKLAAKIGLKNVLVLGLTLATIANTLFFLSGNILWILVVGVALMGFGFMLVHSTLLTILTVITEIAARNRGVVMSLFAFCFTGGGGVGTAMGSIIIQNVGYESFFSYYGLALFLLIFVAALIVKTENERCRG